MDLESFFEDPAPPIPTNGGKREGAGRPKGAKTARDKKTGETQAEKFAEGRARKELANAQKAEVDAAIALGAVVDRIAVREACAKAFAACSQSLDSIPDDLERTLGVEPDVTIRVRDLIDAAKAALAADLQKMFEDGSLHADEMLEPEDE